MQKMLERVLESGGFLYCRTCELRVFGDGATGGAIIEGLEVGRNGWTGGPEVVQQVYQGDELRVVIKCGACGSAWRLEAADALDVADAFLKEAARTDYTKGPDGTLGHYPRYNEGQQRDLLEMAKRVLAGYPSLAAMVGASN